MGESNTEKATVAHDIIRSVFAFLDKPAYWLLGLVYQLFFNVASADIFSNDTIMKFYGRVQVILGVFMMFQLAMTILRGIVEPDNFTKDKGAGSLIRRVVVSLLLITTLMPVNISSPRNEYEAQVNNNGLLFGTLYSLQHRLLANNTIGRLVLGTTSAETSYMNSANDTELKKSARIFASTILKGFYRINLDPNAQRSDSDTRDPATVNEYRMCKNIPDSVLQKYMRVDAEPSEIIEMVNETCTISLGEKRYVFNYMGFLPMVVALVFAFILLSFTVDVAVRAVKLAVLRLIAPIPLIAYINPTGKGDESFKAWTKTLTTTYLDLFIRLATVYFVIFLIQDMIAHGVIINYGTGVIGVLSLILLWFGLFIFAKQAPKFIKDVLGLKGDTGKLFSGFGDIAAVGAAGLGMIGSARANYRASRQENNELHPDSPFNGIRNVGSALAGAIGGGYTGIKALGQKDATARSVMDAQSQRNATRAAHSTFPGRVASDMYGVLAGRSLATRDQAILDANKAAADSMKAYKTTAVDEAMKKGSYGTVSAAKDRTGHLAGIRFNYRRLEAALGTKDTAGNFDYTDDSGTVHHLNAAWFDQNVMADIEDSQTANYLRSNWSPGARRFTNDKINTEWRKAQHDMTEAEIDYRGDYLGDINAGSGQDGGDYAYGDIGNRIGRANTRVTDMSTNMRNIMNRANSRGKK